MGILHDLLGCFDGGPRYRPYDVRRNSPMLETDGLRKDDEILPKAKSRYHTIDSGMIGEGIIDSKTQIGTCYGGISCSDKDSERRGPFSTVDLRREFLIDER